MGGPKWGPLSVISKQGIWTEVYRGASDYIAPRSITRFLLCDCYILKPFSQTFPLTLRRAALHPHRLHFLWMLLAGDVGPVNNLIFKHDACSYCRFIKIITNRWLLGLSFFALSFLGKYNKSPSEKQSAGLTAVKSIPTPSVEQTHIGYWYAEQRPLSQPRCLRSRRCIRHRTLQAPLYPPEQTDRWNVYLFPLLNAKLGHNPEKEKPQNSPFPRQRLEDNANKAGDEPLKTYSAMKRKMRFLLLNILVICTR